MRALVTGASGFIGAPVVRALEAQGVDVHTASRKTLDLLEPGSTDRLIRETKPDVLVHLAWETAHREFWDAPSNVDWTAATLRLAREFAEAGGTRFVGLGTCAEYSWENQRAGEPLCETTPRSPATLYGAAKNATFELLCRFFAQAHVSFAWGRLFFPYGPGGRRLTLIPELIRKLLAGEPVPLTSGTQVRDFIYVDDAARAIASLASTRATGAFNIATGVGVSVSDVAYCVASEMGRADLLRVGELPDRENEPPWLVGSSERITSETGWRANVTLKDGIRETLRWWRDSQ